MRKLLVLTIFTACSKRKLSNTILRTHPPAPSPPLLIFLHNFFCEILGLILPKFRGKGGTPNSVKKCLQNNRHFWSKNSIFAFSHIFVSIFGPFVFDLGGIGRGRQIDDEISSFHNCKYLFTTGGSFLKSGFIWRSKTEKPFSLQDDSKTDKDDNS